MVLEGDLQALLQMYILMEEHQRYIMKITNTCRNLQDTSHPSALDRVIHFILDLKLKLVIFLLPT
jgi:hypothetical protein